MPWPILTTSIAKKWLNDGDGLQDRGITRDLDWGVPVRKRATSLGPAWRTRSSMSGSTPPSNTSPAPRNGPTERGAPTADWERWWRTDKGADDVRYVQFMGKDNVPFHTLSFPATIIGSGEPWKLVDYIKSFNYLNYDGGQFSTSQGRGVFMDQALEILPADYWRWWLLSHAPENSDSEFTWDNFQASVNKDLADVLGNFVSRVTKFCRSKFGEEVPAGGATGAPEEEALIAKLSDRAGKAYETQMEAIEIRKAATTELARALGSGQRIPAIRRPLGRLQGRPRQGRGPNPFGAEPDPGLRGALRPLRAGCGSKDAERDEHARHRVAGRHAGRPQRPAGWT